MIPTSPFLHRDERRGPRYEKPLTYAERCLPPKEVQRGRLELYRYRWYVRRGTLGRVLGTIRPWALQAVGMLCGLELLWLLRRLV